MTTRSLLDRFFAWRIDRLCMQLGCGKPATHRIAFKVQATAMTVDGELPEEEVDLRLCATHALAYERKLRLDDQEAKKENKDP